MTEQMLAPDGSNGDQSPLQLQMAVAVESMRVSHWVKNAFVAAPLLFSGRFLHLISWAQTIAAVAAFCFLSSAVYIINDVSDRFRDREHPTKRQRPVASGRLPVKSALIAAGVLVVIGVILVIGVLLSTYDPDLPLHGLGLLVWTLFYLALNIAYSLYLKRIVILDVLSVAMGFVLRAMAGAAAIAVPISPWLVLCTFTLCLFIAFTKRRSEINELSLEQAASVRSVNRLYEVRDIQYMLTVSAALAIVTYSIYCVAPVTVARIGSSHLVWTMPLVIYGLFRYNLITGQAGKNDPVAVLIHDRVMWAVVSAYVLLTAMVLLFGSHPAVRAILEADIIYVY